MPSARSPCCTASKCATARVAQVLGELRRALDDVLPVLVLRVEHPQRVGLDPGPELVAERRRRGRAGSSRSAATYAGRGLGVAHRVDAAARRRGEPEVAVEAVGERDDLDVDLGVVDAEHLDAELPVLAVPALLRPLVPEVRRDVPDLPRHGRVGAARRPGPPARCPRAAGASRRPPLSSNSYISLRTTSVTLADPLEHLEVLEDRGDHEAVAEAPGPVGEGRPTSVGPPLRLGRQDVVGPDRARGTREVARRDARGSAEPRHSGALRPGLATRDGLRCADADQAWRAPGGPGRRRRRSRPA